MSNIYLVVDDRIAFIPGESRSNGMVVMMPVEALVTKFGVLIPTSPQFASFLDFRPGGVSDNIKQSSRWLTSVIDKEGVLRDYFVGDEDQFLIESRVMLGKGIRVCRSHFLAPEEVGFASLKLADTLEDVVDLYCKSTDAKRENFVIHKIADLAKMAAEYKAPTK